MPFVTRFDRLYENFPSFFAFGRLRSSGFVRRPEGAGEDWRGKRGGEGQRLDRAVDGDGV